MSYKIAVATSDGEKIDLHFGEAGVFYIYNVDGKDFVFLERRSDFRNDKKTAAGEGCCHAEMSGKIESLKDCRAVVASKIGFNAQKMLSKINVSIFDDVGCTVNEALKLIARYFYKVDNHLNLANEKK